MRRFHLRRLEDETGISGTGIITEGYAHNKGICVMRWLTATTSIAVYSSIEDIIAIHGHGGKTVLEWDEEVDFNDIPYWAIDPVQYLFDKLG